MNQGKLTYKISSLDSPDDWDILETESETATFFQDRQWLRTWINFWGNKDNVLVFTSETDGKTVCIAPFEIRDGVLTFLGVPDPSRPASLSDFGDIIIRKGYEKLVWTNLFDHMKINYPEVRIELNFVREDSASFSPLDSISGKRTQIEVSPFIALPGSFDEYLLILDRHDRHEIRRKMRKAENEEIEYYCGQEVQTEDFFRLMEASNAAKSKFLSGNMKPFFRELISIFIKRKKACLLFMKYKEENIASILLFYHRDGVFLYNSGYNPDYSFLSPGLMLNLYAIKKAIEDGMAKFDFLRGGENYKYRLGAKDCRLFKFTS